MFLVAEWISNSETDNDVSVTYNNTDGSGKHDTDYPTYDTSKKLSKYTRASYTLIGWSYTEKGAENGNVNFPLDTPVRMVNNLQLYAVWEKDTRLTVIVDDLLLSADDLLPDSREPDHTVIGTLMDNNTVEVTVTYAGKSDLPSEVGVYAMSVTVKVTDSAGTDVTGNYTISVVRGFLTIYRGDHSAVSD